MKNDEIMKKIQIVLMEGEVRIPLWRRTWWRIWGLWQRIRHGPVWW